MLRARVGWKLVMAIVLFLFVRAVVATVIEVKVGGDGAVAYRIIGTVLWGVLLAGIALGKEPARFAVIMLLSFGSALAVAVLLDPEMMWYNPDSYRIEWIRYYLMAFIGTNLLVVPLLAFSKPVRSYFSRMPAYAGPIQ